MQTRGLVKLNLLIFSLPLVELKNFFLPFVEVRDHGVGYYQFSKDEAERKSQMEVLDQLRDQVTVFFYIQYDLLAI